jgi:hypothetical protein
MPIMTSQHTNRTRTISKEEADLSFAIERDSDGALYHKLTVSFRDEKGMRQYTVLYFTQEEFHQFVGRATDYRAIMGERMEEARRAHAARKAGADVAHAGGMSHRQKEHTCTD